MSPLLVADRSPEQRAERYAGAIYGTIVTAGVLAATGPDDEPDVGYTALYVISTVAIFWLAHAWATSMARRATGTEVENRGLRETLAITWPLVQSAFPPVGVMLVASLLGAKDETAIALAGWSCVLLLGGWGVIVARQEHSSPRHIATTALGCAALGGVMILLKTLLH